MTLKKKNKGTHNATMILATAINNRATSRLNSMFSLLTSSNSQALSFFVLILTKPVLPLYY